VRTDREEQNKILLNLTNIFLHGMILFSISYLLFWIQVSPFYWSWSSLLVFNITISILLVFMIGVINMMISESIWSITLKSSGESWISQGFLIVLPTQILLLLFQSAIQIILTNLTITSLVYGLILFFVYSVIFGFIGKTAAMRYIENVPDNSPTVRQEAIQFKGTRGRCPSCGESFRYSNENISDEGTVKCLNCKHIFYIEPKEELLRKLGKQQKDVQI
jgi:predicted Zn finger-like uncharacterized protein